MARPLHVLQHYTRRLMLALNYIESNLCRPIALAVLAEQAAFSPYHFHRLFCEWLGETPQEYIRRQRLERGAALLHYGHVNSIKDIASYCGFTSSHAFHRAFKNYFGMTPSDWRIGGYNKWSGCNTPSEDIQRQLLSSQVQIKYLQPIKIVYMRKLGSYKEELEQFWEEFANHTEAMGLSTKSCFGIGLDDPAVTPTTQCRYDLCVAIPDTANVPKNMSTKLIGGGMYAVLPYRGQAGETKEYWLWILQIWLLQSRYKVGQHSCFEHFLDGVPVPGILRSELYLPLARCEI